MTVSRDGEERRAREQRDARDARASVSRMQQQLAALREECRLWRETPVTPEEEYAWIALERRLRP